MASLVENWPESCFASYISLNENPSELHVDYNQADRPKRWTVFGDCAGAGLVLRFYTSFTFNVSNSLFFELGIPQVENHINAIAQGDLPIACR